LFQADQDIYSYNAALFLVQNSCMTAYRYLKGLIPLEK
jgi:hypothetical protein